MKSEYNVIILILLVFIFVQFYIFQKQSTKSEIIDQNLPTKNNALAKNNAITNPDPNDIPPEDEYIPIESPPNDTYVYFPDRNVYLLPYSYLDFNIPFHRWMYYYYPEFYYSYYDNNWPFYYPRHEYYGYYNPTFRYHRINGRYWRDHNYDRDEWIDSKHEKELDRNLERGRSYNRSEQKRSNSRNRTESRKLSPSPRRSPRSHPAGYVTPNINTQTYPNKNSGFAGGWGSQKFIDGRSSKSGLTSGRSMGGFGGGSKAYGGNMKSDYSRKFKEHFDNLGIDQNITNRGGNTGKISLEQITTDQNNTSTGAVNDNPSTTNNSTTVADNSSTTTNDMSAITYDPYMTTNDLSMTTNDLSMTTNDSSMTTNDPVTATNNKNIKVIEGTFIPVGQSPIAAIPAKILLYSQVTTVPETIPTYTYTYKPTDQYVNDSRANEQTPPPFRLSNLVNEKQQNQTSQQDRPDQSEQQNQNIPLPTPLSISRKAADTTPKPQNITTTQTPSRPPTQPPTPTQSKPPSQSPTQTPSQPPTQTPPTMMSQLKNNTMPTITNLANKVNTAVRQTITNSGSQPKRQARTTKTTRGGKEHFCSLSNKPTTNIFGTIRPYDSQDLFMNKYATYDSCDSY
jgi:hypothetical protein